MIVVNSLIPLPFLLLLLLICVVLLPLLVTLRCGVVEGVEKCAAILLRSLLKVHGREVLFSRHELLDSLGDFHLVVCHCKKGVASAGEDAFWMLERQ